MSKLPEKEGQNYQYLYKGLLVDIVLKQDQKTMTLTRGYIKDFLTTSKEFHPRGLKVMLDSSKPVIRLYDTSPNSKDRDVVYNKQNKPEDYIGRVQRVHYPYNYGLIILNKDGELLSEEYLQVIKTHYEDNLLMPLIISENEDFPPSYKLFVENLPEDKKIELILKDDILQFILNNQFYYKNNDKFILCSVENNEIINRYNKQKVFSPFKRL